MDERLRALIGTRVIASITGYDPHEPRPLFGKWHGTLARVPPGVRNEDERSLAIVVQVPVSPQFAGQWLLVSPRYVGQTLVRALARHEPLVFAVMRPESNDVVDWDLGHMVRAPP